MRHFLYDELPDRLSGIDGKSALVFGPEGKGLNGNRLCDLFGNNSNVGRLSNTESKSCCYDMLFLWFTGV